MSNTDEFEDMPELTDTEPDTPTLQQPPSQVQSTVVPSVLAETHSSFPDVVHDVQLQDIEETTMWVHWLLANLHDSRGWSRSEWHPQISFNELFF